MSKEEILRFLVILALITPFFFFQLFFRGYVPFPGDLLIAEYNPWKTYSYLGYVPGSYPNKAQYFDVLRQIYPWKTLVLNQLRAWDIPLWNPYNFSGAPILANFQSGVFNPFNLLYLVFSQIQVWSILVILQPLLASFFTYLFARKICITKIACLFSAISYGFSSFMIVWLEYNTIGHIIMWLPLSLLAIEMLLKQISFSSVALFILSILAALFAGHPQVFIYSLIFIVAYIVYRIFSLKKLNIQDLHTVILSEAKDLMRFFGFQPQNGMKCGLLFFCSLILLAIGIGAVQIVPGIELIKESARASHDYNFLIHKILIQPWQFVMMVVPDFFGNPATRNYWLDDTYIGKVTYIGVIPLFFALFSFRYLRNSLIRFFAVAGIIVLLLVSFNPITIFLYKINLPIVSGSSSTLSIFLFCFCASLLSGFGIDIWRREKQGLVQLIRLVSPLVLIIIFLWIIAYFIPQLISDKLQDSMASSYRNLVLATFLIFIGIFLIIIGTLNKKLIYGVLIALFVIQTGDLLRFFTKFNPFVPQQLVFPNAPVFEFLKKESGIDRFWGYGSGNIEANFATQYRIYSADGYDPLYPKRYGEFIQASKNGKIAKEFTRQTRSDAFIAPGFGESDLSSNIYRLKILDLLGVKYILDRVENGSSEKTFPKDRFKLIYEKDGWKVFENLKVLPRAFLVSDYKVFRNNDEFEKKFFDKNFDPSKTILLEENINKDLSLRLNGSNHLTNLQLVSYTPNKIFINSSAETNQLIFLSDTYYPGWKAFVDDKRTKIYRANYAFRSIVVPKGKHQVSFVFAPDSFRIGLGITILSLSLLPLLTLYIKSKY